MFPPQGEAILIVSALTEKAIVILGSRFSFSFFMWNSGSVWKPICNWNSEKIIFCSVSYRSKQKVMGKTLQDLINQYYASVNMFCR